MGSISDISYNKDRAAILIVPHFDDEIFQVGSFLLSYKNNIELVFTHPCDTIGFNSERYNNQLDMMHKSLNKIKEYRTNHGMISNIKVTILPYSKPNGIGDEFLNAIHDLESIVNKYPEIDYYIYSVKSSHQSHQESHKLAEIVLRSPFIEKINNILEATYPQNYFGIINNTDDAIYNTYNMMDKEMVDLLVDIIGTTYGQKNPPNSILSPEGFRNSLQFYGYAGQCDYAQPFIIKRRLIDLNWMYRVNTRN